MGEHSHVMGGSSAAQRIHCPGSFKLEKEAPEKPDSDFAMQGTVLHSAMELLIVADPPNMEKANQTMAELVGQSLGYDEKWVITEALIDDKIRPAMVAWFDVRKKYELDDWFIEQRLSLETVIDGAYGTADIVAIDTANRLHILDWKFGDGVGVGAEGNLGLSFYAACALYDDDPEMKEFCDPIDNVVLHIVQPRAGGGAVLDTWEAPPNWVEDFIDLACEAMKKAHSDEPPLKMGEWCRWCAAKVTCPAQNSLASEALSKTPSTMTGPELAVALEKATLLKGWIGEVFTLAQTEMEGGAAVPGYKLVQKQPRRIWQDEAKAEKLLKQRKVKVKDMYKRALLTPPQLQKKLPELYSAIHEGLVILHSSGLTIVPDTDKREAVVSSMALLSNAMKQTENTRN